MNVYGVQFMKINQLKYIHKQTKQYKSDFREKKM